MCDNSALSTEHVPPKCIFPEGSRQNLITVPSCSRHNSEKSGDDEYLRDILAERPLKGDDNVHQNALNDKVDRADKRNTNRRQDVVNNAIIIGGKLASKVDRIRLENIFHHIVTGILLHHYGKQCLEECKLVFLFLNPSKSNCLIYDYMSLEFKEYAEYGENKEIFKYKVTPIEWLPNYAIQMNFFNDIKIIGRGKTY